MAKNLAYLRAQTRTYLDEATQLDWRNDEVDREINNGYMEVVTLVQETYEDFYVKTAQLTTIDNQQEYTSVDGLPEDIFKVRRVEINYRPTVVNSTFTLAHPAVIDEVPGSLSNTNPPITSLTSPVYYFIGGGSGATGTRLGFIPIPTEGGTNMVKIWYVYEVPELVDSLDEVVIPYPDRYAALISRYAAAVLLSKGQQEEKVSIAYMTMFENGLLKLQRQFRERLADRTKSTIDTRGEDNDFSSYGII